MGLFLKEEVKLDRVVFVLFTSHDLEVYKKAARALWDVCDEREAITTRLVRHCRFGRTRAT